MKLNVVCTDSFEMKMYYLFSNTDADRWSHRKLNAFTTTVRLNRRFTLYFVNIGIGQSYIIAKYKIKFQQKLKCVITMSKKMLSLKTFNIASIRRIQ